MKHAISWTAAAVLLHLNFSGLVLAGPYDNFPLVDASAEAAKKRPPQPSPAAKVCYLFNPPSFDRQWQVSCDPSAAQPAPTKMCRIMTTSGWDAALFTEPCADQEARAGKSPAKP